MTAPRSTISACCARLVPLLVLAAAVALSACGPAGSAPAQPTSGAAQAAQGATPPAAQSATPPAAQAQAPTSAAAPGKPVSGGQLVLATERDATTFDPLSIQDVYSAAVESLTVDSLFEINDQGQVVGRLVDKVDTPQPNVYVLTLKQGIKFQDGTDFNADAVKFNLERHINNPKSVRIQDVKNITSIETPDPYTVKITLDAPYAPFLSKLTTGAGYMLSPTAVQKLGDNLQRDLTGAGSGPYKLAEWQKDTQIVLEKNPDFWGKDANGTQLPYLDRIIFKPFPDENVRLTNLKTGDADGLISNPPFKDVEDLKNSPDISLTQLPGLGFQLIDLNTQKEPFNNPAVRRALAEAIDRDQLNTAVLFGTGNTLSLPVPPSVPWAYVANQPYAKPNIDKAKQELASAGLSNVSFSLQISNNSPQLQQVAELIKDQIKDAGFTMDIQLIEFATIVQNGDSGDYQALCLGWSGSVDPDGNLYTLLTTGAGFNFPKYSNPQFDKLVNDARATLDQTQRGQLYVQAQQVLTDDQPMVVLYSQPQIAAFGKNVQNYPKSYNEYWGVRDLAKTWKSSQ